METWKPVEGYNTKTPYLISSEGKMCRVRKSPQFEDNPNKLHKGAYDKDGYIRYSIRENGKKINVLAHRLVAKAFIPNPNNLPEINHKNGIRDDNRIENLEWVTPKQNVRHAYDVLGRKGHNGGTNKPVNQISLDTGEVINTFDSLLGASKHLGKVNQTNLCIAINQRDGVYGGYKWELVDKGVETTEK